MFLNAAGKHMLGSLLALAAAWFGAPLALAQGQDSTPAERSLLIMAELLPGLYDNANQNYFDRRRGLPEADRHPRINTRIERIAAPAFGPHAFLWTNTVTEGEQKTTSHRIVTLSVEPSAEAVVMRHYFDLAGRIGEGGWQDLEPADLRRTPGCDYLFRRRAGQFRGVQADGACRFEWEGQPVYTDNTIELSPDSLWFVDHKYVAATGSRITGVESGEPFWLERAREFHCYADIPGVGGGRDIPFERYDGITLHDKGGSHWFRSRGDEPREIGLVLQSVTWHILNEKDSGNFNRNSLVIYIMEKLPDGSMQEHGYAFTEPDAERIGVNLKWMLVNCSMTPRDQARPEL
jgi:hypothetical protein